MAKRIALILVACLMAFLLFRARRGASGHETPDSQAVVKEIRQMNELVTVKYSVEKVIGLKEDRLPVGEESILLLVQGKVLAGINLSELTPDDVTMTSSSNVRIHLPQPHIQEAFIDEKHTKVWERNVTWWTPWVSPDADMEHRARLRAIELVKSAAIDMGILKDAQRNAETSIRVLLQAFGINA